MTKRSDVISDEEILKEHWGNFGPTMTPRGVVDAGVRHYAHGFSTGHTMMSILLAHGLIRKPEAGSYQSTLTKRGLAYARALWSAQRDTIALAVTEMDWALGILQRRLIHPNDQGDVEDFATALARLKDL